MVVLGAYVRLSDAGRGCPDWPGCYGHIGVPQAPHKIAKAPKFRGARWHAGVDRDLLKPAIVTLTCLAVTTTLLPSGRFVSVREWPFQSIIPRPRLIQNGRKGAWGLIPYWRIGNDLGIERVGDWIADTPSWAQDRNFAAGSVIDPDIVR